MANEFDPAVLEFCQAWLSAQGLNSAQMSAMLDTRGLACPMPLLKAKVALRAMNDGEALYLLASDKNSQTDLLAFCQKNYHSVQMWTTHERGELYHFVIVKQGNAVNGG